MDGDLRKPKLSRFVNDNAEGGLTHLFTEAFSHDPRSGRLTDYQLSDLLWLLAFRKKSGLLRLNEGEKLIQCHVQQGRLIDIEWLDGPSDPRMDGLLPQNQTVSQQAYPLMSKGPLTGKRLASLLIHLGVIQQDSMADFIRRHLIEGCGRRSGFMKVLLTLRRWIYPVTLRIILLSTFRNWLISTGRWPRTPRPLPI